MFNCKRQYVTEEARLERVRESVLPINAAKITPDNSVSDDFNNNNRDASMSEK
jgi:hypothetical protein